jgi:sugar phosphate isomerase/epimerase
MDKNNIVINTLVFLDDLNKGTKQSILLRDIYGLGASKAEVRREFIKDFQTELQEIKAVSEELKIELYYSVPGYLFKNGELNTEEIEGFFIEARKMGCRNVKLNIGDYNELTPGDSSAINSLCDKYSIKLTVENDQTEANGRVDKIERFLKAAGDLSIKVSCTFDMGNWLWQGEDPMGNAYRLKPYVTYIHLKDVGMDGKPHAVLLNQGEVPWRDILKVFDGNVPTALEYPCSPDAISMLKIE